MNRTGFSVIGGRKLGKPWASLSQARDLGTSLIVIVNNDLQAAAWCYHGVMVCPKDWGIFWWNLMDYGDLAQNGSFKREKRMENYDFFRLLRSSLWTPHISTPIWGQTQEEWGRNATACAWTGKTCPILAVRRCRGGSHWWRRVSGWNVAMLSCPAIQGLFWWHRLIWVQWIWMCPSWKWNSEGFRSSSRH